MVDPVTILCGDDGDIVSFQLERSKACSTSRYLATYLANKTTPEITISDIYPEELRWFRDWIWGHKTLVDNKENLCMREPWLSNATQAWLLGQRLEAPEFQKFCLERFIDNCALALFGPWKIIEENAGANSPLRRFSNHWIAWNVSLVQDGPHEYRGLKAVALAKDVDEYTGDPRKYGQEHWYSDCGDQISPRCEHNPRVTDEKTEQAQHPEKPPANNECSFELPKSTSPKHLILPKESRRKLRIKDSRNSLYVHYSQST
ncbi:hypothetical protein FSARC_10653 [Fusarium sarcochroum]|uniref:Uncharacterized protein n=1 Tax=Fusarium sarcochroum TaxID=1208366 RepID=A0A8H4TKR5_9HYPO|nr:hypothetical protein FSARC_10653 [Fusarium sarcochroum]